MEPMDEIVMYIVVNKDLGMSPGKVAAQVGHGVELALALGRRWYPQYTPQDLPCAKIVLQADAAEFSFLLDMAEGEYMDSNMFNVVVDEGRTEVPPNTKTVVSLCPVPKRKAFPYVMDLKLYK